MKVTERLEWVEATMEEAIKGLETLTVSLVFILFLLMLVMLLLVLLLYVIGQNFYPILTST